MDTVTVGTGEPSQLEMAGFMALRNQVFSHAGAIEAMPPETFDRLIEFIEAAKRRSTLRGASRQELDAVENDLSILRACKSFRKALTEVGERAAARAKITGPPAATA